MRRLIYHIDDLTQNVRGDFFDKGMFAVFSYHFQLFFSLEKSQSTF